MEEQPSEEELSRGKSEFTMHHMVTENIVPNTLSEAGMNEDAVSQIGGGRESLLDVSNGGPVKIGKARNII